MIITGNTYFKTSWEAYKLMEIFPRMSRAGIKQIPHIDITYVLKAHVNYGRWGISCECGGAEYAWEEKVFMCQSCFNASHKHQFGIVKFPDERMEIEAILESRPTPFRNWNNLSDRRRLGRDETVDDLKAENEAHKTELLEAI